MDTASISPERVNRRDAAFAGDRALRLRRFVTSSKSVRTHVRADRAMRKSVSGTRGRHANYDEHDSESTRGHASKGHLPRLPFARNFCLLGARTFAFNENSKSRESRVYTAVYALTHRRAVGELLVRIGLVANGMVFRTLWRHGSISYKLRLLCCSLIFVRENDVKI